MQSLSNRKFEVIPAVRQTVPLWVGIVGSSGSGKTLSALRLAAGMSKVYGDGVYLIDTEARRSAHYADDQKFSIIDFKPPFGPLDYLEAIKHCVANGAKTIIVDSMSHEWEGEGGVLEQHDTESERLAALWKVSRDKAQMSAWQKPKGDHRRLLSYMLQSGVNFILCYRAKEKLKIVQGKNPMPLGWQPVGPDDLVYEATVNMLLMPGSKGVPTWSPEENAEKQLIKLPRQFEAIFKDRKPLDEATGEALAKWAAGGAAPQIPANAQVEQPTPVAGNKPTKDEITALKDQLVANGLATTEARLSWLSRVVGDAITNPLALTRAEYTLCMEEAEKVAAA